MGHCRRLLTILAHRAHAKYKLVSIMLSVLMVYMLAASVVSSIKASSEGGAANATMLFSVIITFGGKWYSCMLSN